MPVLTNVTINKVWAGKAGESQYGPWQAYNFKVEGHEEKFGYFQSGSKPTPAEGMVLELLQYETKQNGEYTNHNVKKMDVASGGAAPPAQSSGAVVTAEPSAERAKKQREQEIAGKAKGYQIAYQGLGKFVATPGATPEENHHRITAQYELMEKWAQSKASAGPVDELYKAIDAKNLGPHKEQFIGWLAHHYKQTALDELSTQEITHAIINLPAAIKAYRLQDEAEGDLEQGRGVITEPEEPEDECPF